MLYLLDAVMLLPIHWVQSLVMIALSESGLHVARDVKTSLIAKNGT